MAEGVCQRLAQRLWWVKWIIDSLEEIRHDAARYGQVVAQETIRTYEKPERVVAKLPVVEELRTIYAAKTSNP